MGVTKIRSLGKFASALITSAALMVSGAAVAKAGDGDGSPWGKEYFPNVPLVTQDGKTVHFFDDLIKDKVVAINFIFTSCADSCPMETARLREVNDLLGDRVGKDVFIYSITIDPDVDTPTVLKEYKEDRFQIKTPGWVFLTGKESDIIKLRQKLGLYMPELAGSTDHNLSLIVGNQKTGRWQKASPFENPYILANQLGSVLHNWKDVNPNRNLYKDAPLRLRQISKGEQLFRTRCGSCHVVGTEQNMAMRSVGPDLKGISDRRERAWLERWLKEPDVMLKEKDPIAVAMLEQYKVPMPNLRLNDTEVASLLQYIDDETVRLSPVKSPNKGGAGHEHHGMQAAGHEGHSMDHGDHQAMSQAGHATGDAADHGHDAHAHHATPAAHEDLQSKSEHHHDHGDHAQSEKVAEPAQQAMNEDAHAHHHH